MDFHRYTQTNLRELTLLQVKNELRYLRRGVELYQLTCQQEYLEDIKPHSQKAQLVPILSEGVEAAFEGKNFNLIYLGRDIGQYEAIFLRKELPALGQCVLFDIALLCRHAAKVVAGHVGTHHPHWESDSFQEECPYEHVYHNVSDLPRRISGLHQQRYSCY